MILTLTIVITTIVASGIILGIVDVIHTPKKRRYHIMTDEGPVSFDHYWEQLPI